MVFVSQVIGVALSGNVIWIDRNGKTHLFRLLLERDAQRVQEHTAEYEIDNSLVYDILDQICKDTDLHKSKRDGRGAFYAIHSRCLDPNHVNATASEAEMVLQMST